MHLLRISFQIITKKKMICQNLCQMKRIGGKRLSLKSIKIILFYKQVREENALSSPLATAVNTLYRSWKPMS